jgi:cardiolipin synthase A/B
MHFSKQNHIELLRNGEAYFPALISAIDEAQHEVHLQTYIYEVDTAGKAVGEALKRAAQRGAGVYLLLDGFGSKDMPKSYVHDLQEAGVQVMFYRPKISPWTLKRSRLRRLHRKIAVVDGRRAFVGGINIIDDYNAPDKEPPRIDYAASIEGDLVPQIRASARGLWRRIAWSHLRTVDARTVPAHRPSLPREMLAAYVMRDNLLHRKDIEHAYLKAIKSAKAEILIANAYFVPGKRFRTALIDAAKRGVRVRLLLQGRMEYFLMFATHAFYAEFLKNGIEIYEYRKSFMHSKVAVIDQQWATVGSSNIDPFSLLLAREANIIVLDKDFAQELSQDIERCIMDGSEQVLSDDWLQGHHLKRTVSWLVYHIVRLVTGLVVQPDQY